MISAVNSVSFTEEHKSQLMVHLNRDDPTNMGSLVWKEAIVLFYNKTETPVSVMIVTVILNSN